MVGVKPANIPKEECGGVLIRSLYSTLYHPHMLYAKQYVDMV